MDTNKKLREQISALVDGALPETDVELAFAALQEKDGKQAWDLYHLIRDNLRATPAPGLSAGFAERLAARLVLEPAPLLAGSSDSNNSTSDAESIGLAAILSNRSTP